MPPPEAAVTPPAPLPRPSPLAAAWDLDPSVVYLNHGSFGACPREIRRLQAEYVDAMEREAVRFWVREAEPLLDAARAALAAFVGCPADDFAFVPNATAGVNTVVNSLRLQPGDELLTTTHEYNACTNALQAAADRWGATVVCASVPFPVSSPAAVEEAILAAVTPRTRLVLLSHITSPTALVLPVESLAPTLEARGVQVLVDGAHTPGHIPLAVAGLGCSYYTGNFHKWLCAPKGAAFLYVRPDRQPKIRPLIVSHGANSARTDRSRFRLEFDYVGTVDISPALAAAHCAEFLRRLAGEPDFSGVMRRNQALARHARQRLCASLGIAPPAPDSMLANMTALPIPPRPGDAERRLAARPSLYGDALQDALLERHGIQVPVWRPPGLATRLLRPSAMLYNAPEQYDHLAIALQAELAAEAAL